MENRKFRLKHDVELKKLEEYGFTVCVNSLSYELIAFRWLYKKSLEETPTNDSEVWGELIIIEKDKLISHRKNYAFWSIESETFDISYIQDLIDANLIEIIGESDNES